MPFVAEHLYLSLDHKYESINLEQWPEIFEDVSAQAEVDELIEIIEAIRSTRVDFEIKPSVELSGWVDHSLDSHFKDVLKKMTRFDLVLDDIEDAVVIPLKNGVLKIDKSNLVDLEAQILKLQQQIKFFENEIKRSEKMLSNKNFVERAAAEKVELEQQKYEEYKSQLEICQSQLAEITTNQV